MNFQKSSIFNGTGSLQQVSKYHIPRSKTVTGSLKQKIY